jgi:hypothetical protein
VTEDCKLKDLEAQISHLSKRLDEHMKISRNIIVLCTTLTIGIIFFIFTQTIEHMPAMITLHFMSNLDPIVKEWRQTEKTLKLEKPLSRKD